MGCPQCLMKRGASLACFFRGFAIFFALASSDSSLLSFGGRCDTICSRDYTYGRTGIDVRTIGETLLLPWIAALACLSAALRRSSRTLANVLLRSVSKLAV